MLGYRRLVVWSVEGREWGFGAARTVADGLSALVYVICLSPPRCAFSSFVSPSEIFSPSVTLSFTHQQSVPMPSISLDSLYHQQLFPLQFGLLKGTLQRGIAILLWSATRIIIPWPLH